MPTFLRYLMSLVVHLAWRRAGRSGPIPPMRLPGKTGKGGKGVDLPVIGTWQLMAAMWLAKKIWERYGHDVKGRLSTHTSDLARRAATFLPDPTKPAPFNSATSTAATTPNIATPTPPPALTPRPAPNLQTQVLASPAPTPPSAPLNGAPTPLPSGSILSKLRGRA